MNAVPLYEDFSSKSATAPGPEPQKVEPEPATPPPSPVEPADIPADRGGFDEGYKIGWEDALASIQDQDNKLKSDIATALQEAAFTFFEARQHVITSLRPLLQQLVSKVLPSVARQNFSERIADQLIEFAEKDEMPVRILCAPDVQAELAAYVSEFGKFPVEVVPEETLATSQARFLFEMGSSEIDDGKMLEELRVVIDGFFSVINEQQQEESHG